MHSTTYIEKMEAESIGIYADFLNPARVFGPIFDKELRVSSRRKRNYLLRSIYLTALALYALVVWYSVVQVAKTGSSVYQLSRMAEVGRSVITRIVWFQFVVSQVLAIIMLSSSISDEIRSGTLNVLMTTPINSFQIVAGKLLSKLLQVLLLLTLSFPLLAIFRVFGGVPWHYLVSSFFITLAAVLFAGSLSLLLSVFYRQAYHVILIVLVGYLLLFGILPAMLMSGAAPSAYSMLALINPIWLMVANTQQFAGPTSGFAGTFIHCLIMSCLSIILMMISVWQIRYAAVGSKREKDASRKAIRDKNGTEVARYEENSAYIRRVFGSPIAWKEKRQGFFGQNRTDRILTILLLCLFCLLAVSFLFSGRNTVSDAITGYSVTGIYLAIMVRLAVATAGSIAGEKEARTLPVLLVSPLEDKDIIRGKVKAALWRNIPFIILYLILSLVRMFSYTSVGLPTRFAQSLIQLPFSAISISCSILFLIGCGSFLGVRLKTAATAIAATVGCYFAVTYLFCGLLNPIRIILPAIMRWSSYMLILVLFIQFLPMIFMGVTGLYLLRRSIRDLRHHIY